MSTHDGISRRRALGMAVAAGGWAMFASVSAALAQALRRTPDQILGPFYPVVKPLHQGADLTTIPGKPGRAAGQVIHLMGRAVNPPGQPVQAAPIELCPPTTPRPYPHPRTHHPTPP